MDNSEKLQAEINHLIKQALGSDALALSARTRARQLLGLDDLNWTYFFNLYRSQLDKVGGSRSKPLQIYEEGKSAAEKLIVYPISIAPGDLTQHLKMVRYTDLKLSSERYDETAKGSAMWVKKMQAGSGSSMTRSSYLSRRLGIGENQIKIGAKGTDLFVDLPNPREPSETLSITIAEAQILQSVRLRETGEVGEVIFHDIISSETEESMHKLWDKPFLYEPSKTYGEVVRQTPGLSYFGESNQSFIPTLDERGDISFNRKAPGGHALFAVDALRAAYRKELRPKTHKPLVAAVSNGEDLSSAPDRYMIGYVVKHRVPIALVVTEKTAVDMKGGIISLIRDEDGDVSLTLVDSR